MAVNFKRQLNVYYNVIIRIVNRSDYFLLKKIYWKSNNDFKKT